MRKNQISEALFSKAKSFFPGGVNSPVRAFKSVGGTPVFIHKGIDAHLIDVDGNVYIDYCCSWGPLIHGHANKEVVHAIKHAAELGTSFGAPTALENDLAELILSQNHHIEKLRFVSSGTEAVMSAIRLARGFTGRKKIIKFEGCYHGHSDSLLVKAGSGLITFGNSSSAGVPSELVEHTVVVPLNSINAIAKVFNEFHNEIAAVIIEPIPANNGLLLQSHSFLQFLRGECTRYGALLIFDEVISGFRIGFSGASGYYKINPDIVTYGKIIGGGLPVGAYAASAEIMGHISPEGDVYQAGTLSGNPVAMSAGFTALSMCLIPGFYEDLERKTKKLISGILLSPFTAQLDFKIFSIGSIFWIAFTTKKSIQEASEIDSQSMLKFRKLYHLLLDEGIYMGPSGYEVGFMSSAHTDDDIEKTISAFHKCLEKMVTD